MNAIANLNGLTYIGESKLASVAHMAVAEYIKRMEGILGRRLDIDYYALPNRVFFDVCVLKQSEPHRMETSALGYYAVIDKCKKHPENTTLVIWPNDSQEWPYGDVECEKCARDRQTKDAGVWEWKN